MATGTSYLGTSDVLEAVLRVRERTRKGGGKVTDITIDGDTARMEIAMPRRKVALRLTAQPDEKRVLVEYL